MLRGPSEPDFEFNGAQEHPDNNAGSDNIFFKGRGTFNDDDKYLRDLEQADLQA